MTIPIPEVASTDDTLLPVASAVTARIVCPCGFEAVSSDQDANLSAFRQHDCPNDNTDADCDDDDYSGTPWWVGISNFWTWAIIATVLYGLSVILTDGRVHW